ncbi:MFS transporter [Amphibacillus cookii]|uniref:MFS transporter n=1 Tax=Amphibacillus cookii TaxID=767787 RepID=UPI00195DE580|nr:MFS transporter [Amphibacillus cookii]MBM7542579.1 ACDE family multidrug resistance protein [Amphibacillus cookii]
MKDKKLDLLALASIPLVMTLGNSMLIPVLPIIEKELDISSFQSSLIITVYSVVAIFLIPIAGYLSDKVGRKKVMIPSIIITGVGGAVSAIAAWLMASPYIVILIGRFLQGIGAAGAFPVVIPTVGDMYKDEKDVSVGLGIIETSNTFGKVLSPIIGALLAMVIWYLPFIFIPAFSFIAVLLVLFLVKAPKDDKAEQQTFSTFIHSLKAVFKANGRWLIATFIIGCINMFVLFGVLFHFSSLLESQYKIEGVYKGLLLAIPLLSLCIASYVTGKKIGENKVIMKWLILIGNLASVVPLLFITNEQISIFLITVLLSIAGLGIGVSLPCLDALITEGVEKDIRGTVTSLYSSMRFLGVAAGPPIIALIMKQIHMLYIILASLSALAVVITFFAIKPSKKDNKNVK